MLSGRAGPPSAPGHALSILPCFCITLEPRNMGRALVSLGAIFALIGGLLAAVIGPVFAVTIAFPIFAVGVAIALWGLAPES